MTTINRHLFRRSPVVVVREVALSIDDDDRRHREKLARIVLDEMYQFVALLDAEGTLLEANRMALEGAGILLESTRGLPFWEARWWTVSRETQEQLKEAIRRAAAGEFVRYDVEVYGEASGERTIIIDFSLVPVRDARGEVVFLLPEGRNITEKKRAEAEIARKNRELERLLARIRELDEVKSRFFANVSHELRTPLALILGPVERALADDLDPRRRRDLEVVRRNASSLLRRVNDLLDVAKLDAGQMEMAWAEIDLTRLVRFVAGHFEAIAAEREVRFVVEAPESLVAAADPAKFERVLLNLLSNAFKFVPTGGRVKVALEDRGDRVVLAVQDSGPGVPPDKRRLIFERFRQADDSAERVFGGTGLGLSIARDFVELHRGTIAVTDAPGRGALFLVEMPRAAPEGVRLRRADIHGDEGAIRGAVDELRPAAPERREAVRGPGDRASVLVVEDNPEMNRFIAETLATELDVTTAFDGREGLEALRRAPPDVIVTDIMMPKMSGDRMIAEIRRSAEWDDIPILVLSAKADDALRVRLLDEGAQDYVVKPFAASELRARVRNLAAMKRARDVLQREASSRGHDLEVLAREVAGAKRALAQALEEVRTASRLKDEFLMTLSHELRTPLNAVLGNVQLLEMLPPGSPQRPRAIEAIGRNSRMQARIIDDLLDVSRIVSGKLTLEPEPVAVVEPVDEAIDALALAAEAKDVRVRRRVAPGPPPWVRGDRARLTQVFWNLLSNAIRHVPSGGEVEVEIAAADGTVRVDVTDTGPGIDPDFLPFVFERFRQADGSTTRRYGGLGLGLAIVRHLVELHGGRVGAGNRDGGGARFWIELPAQAAPATEPPARAAEGPRANAAGPLAGMRLLLVEDQEDAREVLGLALERLGADVEVASTAPEAVDVVTRSPAFSALLLDLGLPGEDGYALLRRIRALERDRGRAPAPAVAVTAFARSEDRARTREAGFAEHLAKPIQLERLVEAIRRVTAS